MAMKKSGQLFWILIVAKMNVVKTLFLSGSLVFYIDISMLGSN